MLLKSCRCGKLIPQSMKMCEECERRQQSRHMIYNNTRRDERAAEFYVSKEWRAMRERIIEVYDNVDIYALWDVWRCLAGDCSYGASVVLGGTGSAVWHLAQ